MGLSNFRDEKPWRPPSLLLEADPPRHDAPRRVLSKVLGPARAAPAARGLGRRRRASSSTRSSPAGTSSTRSTALAEAFPLRVFPDAVGIPEEGRENLLPYGDHAFNAFGPRNDLVAKGAPRVAELSAG